MSGGYRLHCFDFKVILPSDEKAYIHILELIHGDFLDSAGFVEKRERMERSEIFQLVSRVSPMGCTVYTNI